MPLAVSAAHARAHQSMDGMVRTSVIEAEPEIRTALGIVGSMHAKSPVARRVYKRLFRYAFRNAARTCLKGADRVHVIYNGLTESALLAAELSNELGIPFVFTPNVLDTSESGSDWASACFRRLYESADQLIALTNHEAQWLASNGASMDKISVIPYGPILHDRSPTEETGPINNLLRQPFILFLGRLVPEKGYLQLIEAFEQLAATDSTTQLVLAGPADSSFCEIIDQVNTRLGSKRLHLIQNITQPLKTALLEEAAVLCVPSNRESLGGVYIEAMACATPVIALDRPVSRCVIDHEQDGLLVANEPAAIAGALAALLDSPDRARQLGRNGKKKVGERYEWSTVAKQMTDVYRSIESSQVTQEITPPGNQSLAA